MNNDKIIILDDSVILKHNYINDDNWEQVMGFCRGCLTYLIANNAIKFFLTHDYFYKNTVISLGLPIHITDESLGIDGDFDDLTEISEILNRIFPANGDRDLSLYLKKSEAEELYQPIGDYVTDDELSTVLEDYYTKDEADERFQPIGEYLTKESGDTFYQPIGDYVTYDGLEYTLNDYAKIEDLPSLDGYATETWVENKGYINEIKTINGIDLRGQGNITIGSGGTYVDSYSKEESDERYQPKGNYVTESTFITIINNLQEQITSIIESISGCCSQTGETIYRWITLTGDNDYICDGTTKYSKQQKQQSTDNGMTWTNVSPAEYQRGTLLETDSPDCGYQPIIEYRWVTVSGAYVCSGTTKYNQEKKQYRVDGGSWTDVTPITTRRGSTVLETNSPDCGYVAPIYRWYQASASDYICSGTSKYYKEYYQVSTDGGTTWTNVTPTQTRTGSLIETQSTDCGYVPTGTKITATYKNGTVKGLNCDSDTTLHRADLHLPGGLGDNTNIVSAVVGDCITEIEGSAFASCSAMTSVELPNTITSMGTGVFQACKSLQSLVIPNSVTSSLGYDFCFQCTSLSSVTIGTGVTSIGTDAFNQCSSLTGITIPNNVTSIGHDSFKNCSALRYINIGTGITSFNSGVFQYCTSLTSVTIPNSVTSIEGGPFSHCSGLKTVTIGTGITSITEAFRDCTSLESVTVRATTPPSVSFLTFLNTNDTFKIYVPAASVNAYKSASVWSNYASRIQAIP